MIGSVSNSSSFNVFSIGNVRSYAANLTKLYMTDNSGLTDLLTAASGSNIFSYLYSSQNTTSTVLQNTQQFARTNVSNLNQLRTASNALSGAAKSLGSNKSTLASSDTDVVSSEGSFYSVADLSYTVNVDSLAKAHRLESDGLKRHEGTTLGAGAHSMSISTDGGTYDISFEVKNGDTNEDVLKSIASAINDSDAGVKAAVTNEDGKSSLGIESEATGAASAFTVSGQAAEALGMDVATQGADASYYVNGKAYTSASNTVTLPEGRGATMTLQGEGSATLKKSVDAESLVKAAQMFADAYNKTIGHLTSGKADGAGVQKALSLVADNRLTQSSISNYGGYAAARLTAIGISIDEDGVMQVDAEALKDAVLQSPATVESALTGYGSLTDTTSKNAEIAMRIPTATYTDFSSMQVKSSLIEMLMPTSGVIFDFGL